MDNKDNQVFRGEIEDSNFSGIKLKEKLPFNFITVSNPADSNCIYTIHHINFKTEENNSIKLYMNESKDTLYNTGTNTDLQVDQKIILSLPKNLIELCEKRLEERNPAEFTSCNYAILLPGGSLVISIEKPITTADIDISWSSEQF